MTINTSKLNHEVAIRYSVAGTVRNVLEAMGESKSINWLEEYYRKVPPKERNNISQRCFEADYKVEPGAVDTQAPKLIHDHLMAAKRQGIGRIKEISQEICMNLPGGNKIHSICTRYRNGPEVLRDRITPVTHIANMEIDPTGIFSEEYNKIQTAHEQAIDSAMRHYESNSADNRLSSAAQSQLRSETIEDFERISREHWAHIDEWINQALHYLTGTYMKCIDRPIVEPALQSTSW